MPDSAGFLGTTHEEILYRLVQRLSMRYWVGRGFIFLSFLRGLAHGPKAISRAGASRKFGMQERNRTYQGIRMGPGVRSTIATSRFLSNGICRLTRGLVCGRNPSNLTLPTIPGPWKEEAWKTPTGP